MGKSKYKKCAPGIDWEVDEIINEDGSNGNKYYYHGSPGIRIILNGNNANRIAGYTLVLYDLRTIVSWLQIVIEEQKEMGLDKIEQNVIHNVPDNLRDKFNIIKALMVASISFYGKLFTQAEGRKIKLEVNIFDNVPELTKIHSEIMMYRHNFSSHSGQKKVESVEVSLILDSKKGRNTFPLLVRTLDQPNAFKNKFLDDYVKICNYLIDKVNNKINDLTKNYYKELTPERIEMMYENNKK